jgi:plasmid replication initiation protein
MTPLELYRKQKESDKKINDIARIDNSFIDSFLKKNKAVTMKILFYIAKSDYKISQFKDIGNQMKCLTIDCIKMCKYCNINLKDLKRYVRSLTGTSITIINNKDVLEYKSLFPSATFELNSNILKIEMYNIILNKILEVEKNFTFINLKNIIHLKSKHSIRIIQILEMINGYDKHILKRKHYTLDEINQFFGTNYKSCIFFQKKVLDVAKKELDNISDLSFIYQTKYKEQSRGRPKGIGFIIDLTIIEREDKNLNKELIVDVHDIDDNTDRYKFKIVEIYKVSDERFVKLENDKYYFLINIHSNNLTDIVNENKVKSLDIFIDKLKIRKEIK